MYVKTIQKTDSIFYYPSAAELKYNNGEGKPYAKYCVPPEGEKARIKMATIKVKDMTIEINASIGNTDYTDLFICDLTTAFSDSLIDAVHANLENRCDRMRDYLKSCMDYIDLSLESEDNKR